MASFYKDWAGIGGGVGNFLSYGDFPLDDSGAPESLWLPRGVIMAKDLANVQPMDQEKITEYVTHSWYTYSQGDGKGLHPYEGETNNKYTGPKPPFEHLDTEEKYSWVKAPRYLDQPMEVGPLARMVIAYAKGQPEVKKAVDFALGKLNVGPAALFSTLGRTAARGIESLVLAQKAELWLDQLADNMGRRNLDTFNGERWDPATWPKEARGFGYHEAPRGALGHWINIRERGHRQLPGGRSLDLECRPEGCHGQPGPYEAALVGTPIAEPEKPLEVLRTVHSFDPCLACAVHVLDGTGTEIVKVRAL